MYEPKNIRQLNGLLETIYDGLAAQNEPWVVEYYASFACEVAVFVRMHSQVDICTLTFPMEAPPLAATHPLMKALPLLEIWIEDYFESGPTDTSNLDHDAKVRVLATQARMQAACIWKGYLFALNTEPANWGTYAVCALGSLRILSMADSAKVIDLLRDETKAAVIRTNVRDDDWPPQGYANLYLKNGDLLEGKLRGRAAWKHGDIDVVKQVARENTARQRQTLEQKPRASPEENTAHASHLRNIDDVMNAYVKMKRADFCDVVAAVVRAGNLSDHDATFALHLREWVRCGADLRKSFPEWLEAEGRERILMLNREWLLSGVDPRMSFNEWLAATDSRQK